MRATYHFRVVAQASPRAPCNCRVSIDTAGLDAPGQSAASDAGRSHQRAGRSQERPHPSHTSAAVYAAQAATSAGAGVGSDCHWATAQRVSAGGEACPECTGSLPQTPPACGRDRCSWSQRCRELGATGSSSRPDPLAGAVVGSRQVPRFLLLIPVVSSLRLSRQS